MNRQKTCFLLSILITTIFFNLILHENNNINENFDDFSNDFNIMIIKTSGQIIIDGNQGWLDLKNAGNCTGQGTLLDPYVIRNLVIDGEGSGNNIYVRDSDVYFIIRNCTLFNSNRGIFLENVENGQIIGNNCSFNNKGISLLESNYNNLSRNTLTYNSLYGIDLYTYSSAANCHTNLVKENTIYSNFDCGIYLNSHNYEVNHITISGNNITANKNHGIFFDFSIIYSNVLNNTINNNEGDGIRLVNVHYFNIKNNTISNNNNNGIYLQGSFFTISGNNITNNGQNGMYFVNNVSNLTIFGNYVSNNGYTGNFDGIYSYGSPMHSTSNQDIRENIINNNTRHGIHFENHIRQSNISNNIIFKNNNSGIYFNTFCYNNIITTNKIETNTQYGAYIGDIDSQYNLFYNNSFINNGVNGQDYGTSNQWNNTFIGNYWDDYGGFDANDDGLGDSPYDVPPIGGSVDYLPIWDDGDDNTPPEISIITPYNNQLCGKVPPNFSISLKGLYINTTWYELVGGTSNHTFLEISGTFNEDLWKEFDNETVMIRFYVNDSLNNIAFDEVIVQKKVIAPRITIIRPTPNEIFGLDSPQFEISVIDIHLDEIWYTLDNGLTNTTVFNFTGKILQEDWDKVSNGTVLVKFFAKDIVKNVNFSEIYIMKDAYIPEITFNIPVENQKFGNKAPEFDISIIEDNLVLTWYTIEGIAGTFTFTGLTGTINKDAWDDAPEGEITITFYAQDAGGNIGSKSIVVIKTIPTKPMILGYNLIYIISIFILISIIIIAKKYRKSKI